MSLMTTTTMATQTSSYHAVRKRTAEACLQCRSKKVRCDILSTAPCVRCRLDGMKCVLRSGDRKRSDSARTKSPPSLSTRRNSDQVAASLFPADEWLNHASWDLPSSGSMNLSFLDDLQDPVSVHYSPEVADTTMEMSQSSSDPPVPPVGVYDLSNLLPEDVQYLLRKAVFVLPPTTVQDSLVKAYFLYVHPFLPIMAEDRFWSDYDHGLKHTSFLVYSAMLVAACPFLDAETVQQWGQSSFISAQESLYHRTRADAQRQLLFDFDARESQINLIRTALLLSFWSPGLWQKASRPGSYWLSVALSLAREMAARHRISPNGFEEDCRIVKCLLWSCIVRESVLTLGYRGTNLMEPRLLDIPPLLIEDLDDPMSYSRIYGREQKCLLGRMFISFTELVILSNDFRPLKNPAAVRNLAPQSGPNVIEHLVRLEKANMEMADWRQRFLTSFGDSRATQTATGLDMILFYRNVALMIYEYALPLAPFLATKADGTGQPSQKYLEVESSLWTDAMISALRSSWRRRRKGAIELNRLAVQLLDHGFKSRLPITMYAQDLLPDKDILRSSQRLTGYRSAMMIDSSIIHAADSLRIFGSPGEQDGSETSRNVDICINIIDSISYRYPVLGGTIRIVRAAINHAREHINSIRAIRASDSYPEDKEVQTWLLEAIGAAKAISFIDRSYFEPELAQLLTDEPLDAPVAPLFIFD
ncbi:hypothetical protein GQ44DRAFT_763947 [Phaeosphaeriaceae sp. PMI808]|nr:hypothetical protein GQ44DRAFT_763947 [Phaeosphaeriaceae sp. PMI808]